MQYVPAPLLQQVNIVDTPGTNVILDRQQRLTEEFVPRADLVLFCLSAGVCCIFAAKDRSESARAVTGVPSRPDGAEACETCSGRGSFLWHGCQPCICTSQAAFLAVLAVSI